MVASPYPHRVAIAAIAQPLHPAIGPPSPPSPTLCQKVLRHPTADRAPAAAVVAFPKKKQLPWGLRALLVVQQGSSLLTFCLATAVLIAYGSTVFIQQEWSREYRKLEQLQREKRDLVAANELMKNQLAQQASLPKRWFDAPQPRQHHLFTQDPRWRSYPCGRDPCPPPDP